MANLASFFQAPSGQRSPGGGGGLSLTTDWTGGLNKGASCAPGVGIGTGDYSPKSSDWSEHERLIYESQQIGQTGEDITVVQGADVNDEVSFVLTAGAIAPDAELKATTGALNKTGKTVPSGSWCWGVVAVA
jgi:hypothetical protein